VTRPEARPPEAPASPRSGEQAHRRATRQLLVARGYFMVCGYIVAMVLARQLRPADFGVYGVIVSAVAWIQMLVAAGIPGAASKLVPEHPDDPRTIESSVRFLLGVMSVVLFVAGWLAAPLIARVFDIPSGTTLFRIALLDIPLTGMYVAYQGIFTGHRRFAPLAIAHATYATAKVIGLGVLLWLGFSVASALLVNVSATALVLIYLFTRFPPRAFRPGRPALRQIAAFAMPMGLYLVAQQVLMSLDLWSLKALWRGSQETVGYYVASLTIGKTLLVIPVVQSGVLFAFTAWALARRDDQDAARHVREASRFALLLIGPAAVIVALDASPVLGLLFSDAYSAGGRFLVFHLIAFGLFAFLDMYMHCIMAAGRPFLAASALLIVLPLIAFANWRLIPALGPIGASFSLVLGVGVGFVASAVMVYRRFGAFMPGRTLGNVVITVAILVVLSRLIQVTGILLLLKLTLLEVAALALLGLLGEITTADFTWRAAPDETRDLEPEPT